MTHMPVEIAKEINEMFGFQLLFFKVGHIIP
jgi:hypothetical protein